MKRSLWLIFPIIIFLALWELISYSGFVSLSTFPPPTKVTIAFWEMIHSGIIFSDLYSSLWRLLIGLFTGSIIGIIVGILTGRIKSFSLTFSPLIQIFRSLPPVAIIPLVIIWFGIGDSAKIFSIAFAVFFPVWINTHIGACQISRTFLQSAQVLTRSKIKTIFKVILPATLPFIIAGIRNGIAIAFIMIFVSELAGASNGLGYRISISGLVYRIDEMMAALFTLGLLGATTDQLFVIGTRRLFPWFKLSTK